MWKGEVVYAGVDRVELNEAMIAEFFLPLSDSQGKCKVNTEQVSWYDSPRGGIGLAIQCNAPKDFDGPIDPTRGTCENIEACTDSTEFLKSVTTVVRCRG